MSMLVNPYAFGGATGSSIVAGSAPTSDQWRLRFPLGEVFHSGGSVRLRINKVEMRATSGGADQCTGGTASASLTDEGSASLAFDSDGTTYWGVLTPDGTSLQYTAATAFSVGELYIVAGDIQQYWTPEQILLEYYNGSTWVTGYTSPTYVQADWPTYLTPGYSKTLTFTPPSYTVAPSISYTFLAVGDTLTGNVGTFSGHDTATYQWKRNGVAISGATGLSYTLVSADIGAQITFAVILNETSVTGPTTGTSASVGPIISAASYATDTLTTVSGDFLTTVSGDQLTALTRTA